MIQASLTGESFPVEKFDAPEPLAGKMPLELKNIAFLGTSVDSGAVTAVIVETGLNTYLGGMASAITKGLSAICLTISGFSTLGAESPKKISAPPITSASTRLSVFCA